MRMCFEIFKLGKREFRPNQGLQEAGEEAESVTPWGLFILLGRMLTPWDLGQFAQHPTMSDSSFVTSHEQHLPQGTIGGPSESIVLGPGLDSTQNWADACVWWGAGT